MTPHRAKVRPLFADVDAMNVVYYGVYLRYFELGRTELIRDRGFAYADMERAGLSLPVTEAGLRYRRPARYDDELTVETTLAWVKRASLRFDYRILRSNGGDAPEELVTGFTTHGCVTHAGKVTPLPPDVITALKD